MLRHFESFEYAACAGRFHKRSGISLNAVIRIYNTAARCRLLCNNDHGFKIQQLLLEASTHVFCCTSSRFSAEHLPSYGSTVRRLTIRQRQCRIDNTYRLPLLKNYFNHPGEIAFTVAVISIKTDFSLMQPEPVTIWSSYTTQNRPSA
jgi:hypothetical protein